MFIHLNSLTLMDSVEFILLNHLVTILYRYNDLLIRLYHVKYLIITIINIYYIERM